MGKYTFDDLLEVAKINSKMFDRFPSKDFAPPPSEETIKAAEDALGFKIPEDYRKMIKKWGELTISRDSGFFGIACDDPQKFDWTPGTIVYDTEQARNEGYDEKYLVISRDFNCSDSILCLLDTTTGRVYLDDDGMVELKENFIDYVFDELITRRRVYEYIYEFTFQWPEYLLERIQEDSIRLKKKIAEFDEIFDLLPSK